MGERVKRSHEALKLTAVWTDALLRRMNDPEFGLDAEVTEEHHADGTVTYHWRYPGGSGGGSSGPVKPWEAPKVEPGPPLPKGYEPQSLKVKD
jgi:hypothetical protein